MENKIIERLDEYMRYAGLNDNKVTVQCGLSNSIIGNARKRGRSLNGENIVKIISVLKNFFNIKNRLFFIFFSVLTFATRKTIYFILLREKVDPLIYILRQI